MKRIVQTLLFCACAVWAQPAQVVVPGGLADVEGNESSSNPFKVGSARLLQVFSASEFNFGAPIVRIDAISFRLDGDMGQSFIGFWQSVSMVASTTTRSPDSLSPVFDENAGPQAIPVFGGRLGIFATDSGTSPGQFDIRIPFSTPFFYVPSNGNLMVDMVTFGGQTAIVLDAQLAVGDTVGRVFANENVSSGMVDSLGVVTRFDITPIPEPSPSVLGMLFTAVMCIYFKMSLRHP